MRFILVAIVVSISSPVFAQQLCALGFDEARIPSSFMMTDMVVAKLDGDSIPDMAMLSEVLNSVSVYKGRGDGTFEYTRGYFVNESPREIRAGFFNDDPHMDLAVAGGGSVSDSQDVAILFGLGDAVFTEATYYDVQSGAARLDVADVNNDGRDDIIVGNFFLGDLRILISNPDGTFEPVYTVGGVGTYQGFTTVEAADFNGDGRTDIAAMLLVDETVMIHLGTGDGSFAEPLVYPTFFFPRGITAADIDNDNDTDLIITHSGAPGIVMPLINDGEARFTTGTIVLLDNPAFKSAVGDINNDDKPDLAIATTGSGGYTILLGYGNAQFAEEYTRIVNGFNVGIKIADFDLDGNNDFVIANVGQTYSSVYMNRCECAIDISRDGTVNMTDVSILLAAWETTAADLNLDGTTDATDLSTLIAAWGPCP